MRWAASVASRESIRLLLRWRSHRSRLTMGPSRQHTVWITASWCVRSARNAEAMALSVEPHRLARSSAFLSGCVSANAPVSSAGLSSRSMAKSIWKISPDLTRTMMLSLCLSRTPSTCAARKEPAQVAAMLRMAALLKVCSAMFVRFTTPVMAWMRPSVSPVGRQPYTPARTCRPATTTSSMVHTWFMSAKARITARSRRRSSPTL
mmetsp:Transcript_12846/g.43430  ORF Transcript_12846/g.43430 Transcript_12846/m.43430 type:complete len:206 (+) Transcript_12846:261-878(+)